MSTKAVNVIKNHLRSCFECSSWYHSTMLWPLVLLLLIVFTTSVTNCKHSGSPHKNGIFISLTHTAWDGEMPSSVGLCLVVPVCLCFESIVWQCCNPYHTHTQTRLFAEVLDLFCPVGREKLSALHPLHNSSSTFFGTGVWKLRVW